jgi:hypothetical protein
VSQPPWDGRNRRAFRRQEAAIEARLVAGDTWVAGLLRQIGRGGAFFESRLLLEVGSVALLHHADDRVAHRVRVAWQMPPGHGEAGLGLRFLSVIRPSRHSSTPAPELMPLCAGGTPPVGQLMIDERRRQSRQRVDVVAELTVGVLRLPGTIRDVSQGGMFFETGARLELGELVHVRHPRLAMLARLRVVRRGRFGGRIGLGLELVEARR